MQNEIKKKICMLFDFSLSLRWDLSTRYFLLTWFLALCGFRQCDNDFANGTYKL